MTKPTLEEANKHFKNRRLYRVDILDYIESRWGTDWVLQRQTLPYLRVFRTSAGRVTQILPKHLHRSKEHMEKYFT